MSDEPLPPESEQPESELPAPLGATQPPLGSLPTAEGAPPPAPPSGSTGGTGDAPVTRRRRGPGHRRAFDFGRVLGGTFTVYFKKLPSILVLSAIIAGPLGFFQVWAQAEALPVVTAYEPEPGASGTTASGLETRADSFMMSIYVMLGAFALERLAILILGGVLAYVVVRHQQGRSVGVREALGRGLSRFLPMLGAGLLLWLIVWLPIGAAITAGVLAESVGLTITLAVVVLIPTSMFFYSVYVALPACAVEGTGPVQSLKRSRALCNGHRWLIFALALVLAIIGVAISMVVTVPVAVTGNAQVLPWAGKVVEVLVIAPLGAILAAMVYVELRAVKEGVDPDGIAEVFA